MAFKEAFTDVKPVEFEIQGHKFVYIPVTGGDEIDWLNDYMTVDEEGNPKQDFSELTKCKLRNIQETPWEKHEIYEITGIDKEWKDLNKEERWNLLYYTKSSIMNEIVEKVNQIDEDNQTVKKN